MIIDPNLLQLVGLGTDGDRYLRDGRHLRWFFGRLLGFPRSGFRLRRHRSARGFDDRDVLRFVRSQRLTQAGLGGPLTPGLRVEKLGGLVFQTAFPSDSPGLRVDDQPVWLDFLAGAQPEPQAADPAAYVLLTFARRAQTGRLLATGWYDTRGAAVPRYRRIDRSAAGAGLAAWFSGLVGLDRLSKAESARLRSGRLPSAADAGATDDELAARDQRIVEELRRTGLSLRPPRRQTGPFPAPPDPDPWVLETVLLHGGLLDRVEVTGREAVLYDVRWLPTALYAGAAGWKEIGLFHLPLTEHPDIYPAWSPDRGEKIAGQRLEEAPPQARAPWDEPDHPPPPLDPAIAAEIRADLMARHVDGDAFGTTDEAMRLFLEGELTQVVPQALVEFEVELEPEEPAEGEEPALFTLRPFDALYAAAVDPAKARVLGLQATDFDEPAGAWDYTIEAAFPELWIRWTTDPEGAAAAAAVLRDALGGRPIPWQGTDVPKPFAPQQVLSMATGIERLAVPLPAPPPDLQIDLVPRPLGKPVQTEAALSWRASDRNLFEAPDDVRVAFAVRRLADGDDVPVHQLDPDLLNQGRRAPVPHLPTADAVARHGGRCRVVDALLQKYGQHEWRVSGMDLFGRFSPFAAATRKVVDLVAPPAPLALRATLEGEAPSWTLAVEWEWPAESAALASDLARFDVHLRQGPVPRADAALPATWGRFEHVAGALTPPLQLAWPAGTVAPPGGGLAAAATLTPDGTTTRLRLEVSPVARAYDAQGHAVVSVAVTAVDSAGNASPFGDTAIVRRLAQVVPEVPLLTGELAFTSLPDAARRCRYRIAIPPLDGGTAQVLRAPEATLRAAARLDAAVWEALPVPQRVGQLKAAAAAHRDLFTPDHAFPYDQRTTEHLAEIPAAERSWTVLTLIATGRTGTPGPWPTDPDRFAVVAVARPPVPPRPEILEVRSGSERVVFSLSPDDSGATAEVRLYRARAANQVAPDVSDIRRMLPVQTVQTVPAVPPILLVDTGLHADVDYWYRLVAVAADGTLSAATEPVRVRPASTEPPRPGEVLSVERAAADPALRAVSFRVPRRDYAVYLFRRGRAEPWAQLASIGALAPDGTVRLSDLTPAPLGGGWRYDVTDTVPDPTGRYRYHVRVIDPRDRVTDSPAVEEEP